MYILVISRERSVRELYVDNLIVRGYLAAGVASVEEGTRLLRNRSPSLVVVCQMSEITEEAEIYQIRDMPGLASTPIVLSNVRPPDSEWMARWGIEAFIPLGEDVRHLIKKLAPWLPESPSWSSG